MPKTETTLPDLDPCECGKFPELKGEKYRCVSCDDKKQINENLIEEACRRNSWNKRNMFK